MKEKRKHRGRTRGEGQGEGHQLRHTTPKCYFISVNVSQVPMQH